MGIGVLPVAVCVVVRAPAAVLVRTVVPDLRGIGIAARIRVVAVCPTGDYPSAQLADLDRSLRITEAIAVHVLESLERVLEICIFVIDLTVAVIVNAVTYFGSSWMGCRVHVIAILVARIAVPISVDRVHAWTGPLSCGRRIGRASPRQNNTSKLGQALQHGTPHRRRMNSLGRPPRLPRSVSCLVTRTGAVKDTTRQTSIPMPIASFAWSTVALHAGARRCLHRLRSGTGAPGTTEPSASHHSFQNGPFAVG